MGLQVWNGSSFVDGAPKVWNGSAFVDPQSIHVWDGAGFQQVWPSFTSVTVNAIGSGDRNAGTAAASKVATATITVVDGPGRKLFAFVAGGGSAWSDNYTHSVVSSIDGAFTFVTELEFGNSSGFRQGVLALYMLNNPSVGEHTVSLTVGFWNGVNVAMGNVICLNNAGVIGTPVTQLVTGASTAQSITIPDAALGDMILVGQAAGGSLTLQGAWPTSPPGLFYADGASVGGEADYMWCGFVPGDGTSKTFSGPHVTNVRHALCGVRVAKA